MTLSELKQPVTLLVHTRFAAFKWGQSIVDHFYRLAPKYGFRINIANDWQSVDKTIDPIVILSADGVWIDECLKHLENNRIVLISDIVDVKGRNTFHISSDQETVIYEGLSHLQQKGFKSTAFFGVQKNDISDQRKADAFTRIVSREHIYNIEDDINKACELFLKNVLNYDSVICANDIIAAYLLSKCRQKGIDVPNDLAIMGNGNLWISAHTSPPLTTTVSDYETTVAVALQTCQNIVRFPNIASLDIRLKIKLICRESTDITGESKSPCKYIPTYMGKFMGDDTENSKELLHIQQIDRVLSALSSEEQRIISMLVNGAKYSEIAEQIHLSEDSIKYHIKKIYKSLNIHRKNEVINLFYIYGITL